MPDLIVNMLSGWEPMPVWQLSDATGIPEKTLRQQYGDTAVVRRSLLGVEEIRPGAERQRAIEIEEARQIIAHHLERAHV